MFRSYRGRSVLNILYIRNHATPEVNKFPIKAKLFVQVIAAKDNTSASLTDMLLFIMSIEFKINKYLGIFEKTLENIKKKQ